MPRSYIGPNHFFPHHSQLFSHLMLYNLRSWESICEWPMKQTQYSYPYKLWNSIWCNILHISYFLGTKKSVNFIWRKNNLLFSSQHVRTKIMWQLYECNRVFQDKGLRHRIIGNASWSELRSRDYTATVENLSAISGWSCSCWKPWGPATVPASGGQQSWEQQWGRRWRQRRGQGGVA